MAEEVKTSDKPAPLFATVPELELALTGVVLALVGAFFRVVVVRF
jgi:hypothetical protein